MYISFGRATIASLNNTTSTYKQISITQLTLFYTLSTPANHLNILIMSQNPDAVVNQGEFAGHVKPSEPLMTGGVSQNVPSFAQVLECAARQHMRLLEAHAQIQWLLVLP
jgi:hypothetical protein